MMRTAWMVISRPGSTAFDDIGQGPRVDLSKVDHLRRVVAVAVQAGVAYEHPGFLQDGCRSRALKVWPQIYLSATRSTIRGRCGHSALRG
jgi:hypothetical protein